MRCRAGLPEEPPKQTRKPLEAPCATLEKMTSSVLAIASHLQVLDRRSGDRGRTLRPDSRGLPELLPTVWEPGGDGCHPLLMSDGSPAPPLRPYIIVLSASRRSSSGGGRWHKRAEISQKGVFSGLSAEK